MQKKKKFDSTWSSMVISVVRVLSVFHFWLKVRPRSLILYLVSRWPPDLPVSVLLEPEVLNSCRTNNDDVKELESGTQRVRSCSQVHYTHRVKGEKNKVKMVRKTESMGRTGRFIKSF